MLFRVKTYRPDQILQWTAEERAVMIARQCRRMFQDIQPQHVE